MKKLTILTGLFLIILCICSICFGVSLGLEVTLNKQIKVIYNGDYQEFQNVNGVKVYPISYDGTTYLPIRSISSLFNTKIKWDEKTKSIYLGEGELDTTSSKKVDSPSQGTSEKVIVNFGSYIKIYYNNEIQTFTDANGKTVYPLSYNGTTYLPVRAVSNLFNLKIDWDGENNTVIITKENENLNTIKIEVNGIELIVELENNQATKELVQKLNSTNIIVNASEYGGFEKVGSLGFALTRDDKQIKTEAGDIVLYQGNQISLFYNSNSWSYTKLGKVTNKTASQLKEILGNGDVTLTLKK